MNNLSPDQLTEAILLCLLTPMDGRPGDTDCLWGLTPHILGEPGLAKTALVKQLCRELGSQAISLFASQHPPEDFSGALIPDGQGGAKQICPLGPVREVLKNGVGVIFLDELQNAAPATQAALQSFIHERRAGDETMPGRVRIIAASNPEGIATGGHRLAPAVANRLIHIDYQGGTEEDWRNWNMGGSATKTRQTLTNYEALVAGDWSLHFSKARGLMNGFIQCKSEWLHKMPARNDKQAGRAWPSRRTIDFAQRAWATAAIIGSDEGVRDTVIEGAIGDAAASDFFAYASTATLPTPQEVLDGTWQPDISRLDIVIGAYTSMIGYVIDQTRGATAIGVKNANGSGPTTKYGAQAWEAVGRLLTTTPPLTDLMVPALQALERAGLGRNTTDSTLKKATTPILLALNNMGVHNFI